MKIEITNRSRNKSHQYVSCSHCHCVHLGPRLDMDPDIVAALDDDFDYDDPENVLDDDFIVKANTGQAVG